MHNPKVVSLTAAFFVSLVQSRTVIKSSRPLFPRAINFDGSCNSHPPVVQGLADAKDLANNAINVLNNPNPFVDGQQPWGPLREALFGPEKLSSTQDITSMYRNIAGDPDVQVFCGEPAPQPDSNLDCSQFLSCDAMKFDAYKNFVDPAWANPSDLNHESYSEQLSCGFQSGYNIVVCPSALPGGSRGFQALSSIDPGPGSALQCYKDTWGAMFVHELSHVFGTNDYGSPYGYGFEGAQKIASDAKGGSAKNGASPLKNADTFSLFALGVYSYSSNDPFLSQFSDFEWSSGYGVQIVLTGD